MKIRQLVLLFFQFAPQAGFLKQRNESSGPELINQPVAQCQSFAWRVGNKAERFADNLLFHKAIAFGAKTVGFITKQPCFVTKQSCLEQKQLALPRSKLALS
jgi:hypothetical protein